MINERFPFRSTVENRINEPCPSCGSRLVASGSRRTCRCVKCGHRIALDENGRISRVLRPRGNPNSSPRRF